MAFGDRSDHVCHAICTISPSPMHACARAATPFVSATTSRASTRNPTPHQSAAPSRDPSPMGCSRRSKAAAAQAAAPPIPPLPPPVAPVVAPAVAAAKRSMEHSPVVDGKEKGRSHRPRPAGRSGLASGLLIPSAAAACGATGCSQALHGVITQQSATPSRDASPTRSLRSNSTRKSAPSAPTADPARRDPVLQSVHLANEARSAGDAGSAKPGACTLCLFFSPLHCYMVALKQLAEGMTEA